MQKKKTFEILEVEIIPHTICNLNCKFCFENKNGIREITNIDKEFIKNVPNEIINEITPIIIENEFKEVYISEFGGELFLDDFSNDFIEMYEILSLELKNKIKEKFPHVECIFSFTSNGLFTKYERIKKLLKNLNAELTLSYDPYDRYNKEEQKELWYKTYNYFKNMTDIEVSVATILTKKSIEVFINGNDFILERLKNKEIINDGEYTPQRNYENYMIGDDDLFNLYKYCIDNQIFSIESLINLLDCYQYKICKNLSCVSGYYYTFAVENKYYNDEYKKYIHKCSENSNLSKDEYYGKLSYLIKDDTDCNKFKKPLGMKLRGCYYCQHYEYCPKICWTQFLFKYYKRRVCPLKRLFDYISNDKENIIRNFNKWRKKL